MSYTRSTAREDFEEEKEKLKKLAKKISYKSSPLSYDHKQLVYQSCIFLLSARIEDYTKKLIEGILYNYRVKGATLAILPLNSRTKAFIDSNVTHFRNFYNSSNEKDLIKNISLANNSFDIVKDDIVLTHHIKSHNIISTNKYPSIKNLRILYHRIGIDDIIRKININSRKDLKTSFESFLSLRESIAHQGSGQLTFEDIDRHFSNVNQFINHIDRIVYKHICSSSGSKYWK